MREGKVTMLRILPAAIAAALLCGCAKAPQGKEVPGDPPAAGASASAQVQGGGGASASATASAGGALKVSEENKVYSFDYSFPAAAGDIPDLRALLTKRMDEARKAHIASAIDARADADKNHYPFNPYAYTTAWEEIGRAHV